MVPRLSIHYCLRLIDNLLIEGVRLFLLRRSEENFSCFLPLISARIDEKHFPRHESIGIVEDPESKL